MAEACEVAPWLKLLPCAPEFRPTEVEFADPLAYISKIEAEARSYGICKIIPPYPRASKRTVMTNLNRALILQASDSCSSAAHGSTSACEMESGRSMGGCMPPQKVGRRSMSSCRPTFSHPRTRSTPPSSYVDEDELKAKFHTRRQQLGCSTGKRSKAPVQTLAQKLVWQSGESYTLEQFEAKAKQFARARLKTSKDLSPFAIESLFWKAAADRTVTVEYGNDIPGSAFREPSQHATMASISRVKRKRGFEEEDQVLSFQHPPKEPRLGDPALENGTGDFSSQYRSSETASSCGTSSRGKFFPAFLKERLRPRRKTGCADVDGRAGSELANSFWNMRVIPRAPGSLLRYMPDEVPGVTSPMLYIGMLFSWFAWHVEDHELHSLNYLHTGAPKTWYAVPGDAAPALEEVVRVYGYGNCTDSKTAFTLLGEKTTVMSPEVLLAAGVPCCRLVQNAGDFVVTFPRAYHLGFSHGFNCGEAANFASPAWLEVAKDAATRRAAMNYLPMLSHQQLLYLLALSFSPRIPLALTFESRSSRSKDTVSSLGEEAIKIVFANDAAHNNRLLGLLLDGGVTGCILLSDGADLSCAYSDQAKVSHSAVGNDSRDASFMSEILLEEACEVDTERKDAEGSNDLGFMLQEFKCPTEVHETPRATIAPFRWGTLPCAACGLLCFPSMAIVQPTSTMKQGLALAQDPSTVDDGNLPSFYLKQEEGHTPDTGHLPSFFAMNDVDLRSDFMRAPLSETMYHPVLAQVKQEGKTSPWEMEQETHECVRDSHGFNGKALGHMLHAEIGNATELQHGLEETHKFLLGSFNCQEDLLSESAGTKVESKVESRELNLVMQKDEVSEDSSGHVNQASFSDNHMLSDMSGNRAEAAELQNSGYNSAGSMFEGYENSMMLDNLLLMNDMGQTGQRVTEKGPMTSVLDLLAATYKDESEDSALHESRKKSVVSDGEHRGIRFQHHSSLLSDGEVGCTHVVPWHCVKEGAECAPSLDGIDKVNSFESNGIATPSNELDNFVCKDVLLQIDDGSYMITERTSHVEPCPFVQNATKCSLEVPKSEFKGAMAMPANVSSSQKVENFFCVQAGQTCFDIPTGAGEPLVGSEKFSQVIAQVGRSELAGCSGEVQGSLCSSLVTDILPDSIRPFSNRHCDGCKSIKIRTCDKDFSPHESSRQLKGFGGDGHHVTSGTDQLVANDFDQPCSHATDGTDEANIAESQILNDTTIISTFCKISSSLQSFSNPGCQANKVYSPHACKDETSNAVAGASLGLNVKGMHIEQRGNDTLPMFAESSTVESRSNILIKEQDDRIKFEVEDLGVANSEIWRRPAKSRDQACNEASHDHHRRSSSNILSRPRFLCLEHALEAHHQLKKTQGGSEMLIICHSDIVKVEGRAQEFAKDLGLTHTWRYIPYREATQEHKHLISMAIKAEEEEEDNSQDWVAQLGMSVRHSEDKILSNSSNCFHRTDVSAEAKPEQLHSLDGVKEDNSVGKEGRHKKVSVTGHWCGKVWMNDEVHPALGGCYMAQTQLQALQNTGSHSLDNAKVLPPEQVYMETVKDGLKCTEKTNLIINCVDEGLHPECDMEIERTNRKRKASDLTGNVVQAELNFPTEVPNGSKRRELVGGCGPLNSSCLTVAVRKKSFEDLTDHANQGAGKDCHNLQSSSGNTSNSNDGNSPVSNVDVIDHDGSDLDIWQELDVGCYSQEVLSLDTIAEVADPLMMETCHDLDAEAQEDLLIPGMLRRRSCSPFDSADFFCEGPSTRLRFRSVAKGASVDDDEVVNEKHNEALFGSGKRRKQVRQRAKKPVLKDLEDECGAYICELDGCSMSFSTKQELNLHKRNTCTFAGCGKRFGSHKYLLQHRRVHLDDRPLKCPWKGCKMTFKWKWACTEHYRVHTGERPYVCPIPECGRTFRFVSDFSRHKRKTGHTK